MAKDEATPLPQSDSGNRTAIRVIVADSEPIFRVGVRKIFARTDDIRIVAQVESAPKAVAAVKRHEADLMLIECGLTESPREMVSSILALAPSLKIVLVMIEPTEEETVELMRRGVRGIITRSIGPDLLIKCIQKVHQGETWLDHQGVNWIIDAYRAQAAQLTQPRNRLTLSQREIQIIAGVTQGLRNKEIALEIGTTEQVVKNYLRKVYDKLGVSDRLELALYCIHHRLLEVYCKADPSVIATPVIDRTAGGLSETPEESSRSLE
ncbi:MAG: DNA-binding response regulator [Acidobacteria bacterium]|nr:MAG: DNA-binding response regulator [Acidobacteriota bacterium]